MIPEKIIEIKTLDGKAVRIRVYKRGIIIERDAESRAFIAGVAVPDWMVEKAPDEIDPRELFRIKNPEVISRLIVKLGPRRVLRALGGKVVDRESGQALIAFDDEGRRRAYFWGSWHYEPWRLEEVDGAITTLADARAWQKRRELEKREKEKRCHGIR